MLGEHVQQTKLEHMKSQMVIFKKSLEEFAIKHRCAGMLDMLRHLQSFCCAVSLRATKHRQCKSQNVELHTVASHCKGNIIVQE